MRRFILITALVLASATAQAGSSRSQILSSNDEATSERIEAVKPAETKPEAAKPETAKPEASTPEAAKPEASGPETSKPKVAKSDSAKPSKTHSRRYDSYASDEARARSIAARYGVSW